MNTKLLAEQSYETLAVLAAVFPQNQNAFGAATNCCRTGKVLLVAHTVSANRHKTEDKTPFDLRFSGRDLQAYCTRDKFAYLSDLR